MTKETIYHSKYPKNSVVYMGSTHNPVAPEREDISSFAPRTLIHATDSIINLPLCLDRKRALDLLANIYGCGD